MKTESERSQMISSYVWLVASDKHQGGSRVVVKDACHPSKVIQSFVVGSSDTNILCICSVPGELFNRNSFKYENEVQTSKVFLDEQKF